MVISAKSISPLVMNCQCIMLTTLLAALISAIVNRVGVPGFNIQIDAYFLRQYSYVVAFLPPDAIALLPPEDQFFIELYDKVILRSARKLVCQRWKKIRDGITTVDAARKCILRLDLKLAAAK